MTEASTAPEEALAISVVVPTRDRPEFLAGCLEALARSVRPFDELIVVDSASTTEGLRAIASAHGAGYLRCDEPGASRARNEGWRRAANDVIAFVDDDVRVSSGWASAVAQAFAGHPATSFLTGYIGIPEGETPEFKVAIMDVPKPFEIDERTLRDPGHSANMAARKSALSAVGGFDELLGGGARYKAAEDKDLIDRLIRAGVRGRYEPAAAANHLAWRERRDILELNWTYGLGLGAWISKLLKIDRRSALRAMRVQFWSWGIAHFIHEVGRRTKFLALVVVVRVIGVTIGIAWALPTRVKNGHFIPRARSRPPRGVPAHGTDGESDR